MILKHWLKPVQVRASGGPQKRERHSLCEEVTSCSDSPMRLESGAEKAWKLMHGRVANLPLSLHLHRAHRAEAWKHGDSILQEGCS